MKEALLVVDVQPTFAIPAAIVDEIRALSGKIYTVATVERHDESITPFERQLGWNPGPNDEPLVAANKLFIKYGYLPPAAAIAHLKEQGIGRVYVCGIQTETCCLGAGFMLFDAGLHPTLLKWLSVGSSLDRSGELGARLWQHHFGSVIHSREDFHLSRAGAAR
jgi:nicotinamidase-related amidase